MRVRSPLPELLAEPRLDRMRRFNDERDEIVAETVRRVVDRRRLGLADPNRLALALNEGQGADIARLARTGTLVLVPTHLSNLDSIAIGFALERVALPPVNYGAGKNLFGNPLLAFFMRNLGAYRVDRRVKHDLYKD